MIKLEIGNSYSKITGLPASEEKKLRDKLSYTIGEGSQYYGGFGPRKKSLLSKRCEFPTGLLHRVHDAIRLTDEIVDNRKKPTSYYQSLRMGNRLKPYDSQIQAVNRAVEAHRGIISMPTGTGKSLVIALIVRRLSVKTLIVVPSIEIKKQLTESLLNALGPGHNAVVENIDSSRLSTLTKFDCIIIDEAHHVAAKTYQRLNKTAWTSIYYRFMLTATPFRNDSEETLLFEGIAGQVIYRLDYNTAVTKGHIVPVEAYYFEVPKQSVNAVTYQQVYKQLVVNNYARNSQIFSLLFSLYESGASALCLVKEVAHGKNIGYPSFASGEDDDSRKLIKQFNDNKINCLVATAGLMGEGVDSKPCEFVIIAGLGKAKSQIMQMVGRAVRKYPGKKSAKVILIKDTSHKFTLRHFNEQKKILLEEYGCVPVKLDIGRNL